MVVAATIGLVIDQQRRGIERAAIGVAILQVDLQAIIDIDLIRPDQVIDIGIMRSSRPVLGDRAVIAVIVDDDIVVDFGMIVDAWAFSHNGADQDAAAIVTRIAILKEKIIADRLRARAMPHLDAEAATVVDHIVVAVPARVAVIDAKLGHTRTDNLGQVLHGSVSK